MERSMLRYPFIGLVAAALLTGCATQTPTPTITAVATTTLPPAEAGPTDAASPEAVAAPAVVFRILADESEARFLIDEILRGSPNTVVGVTSQVSGEILIQPTAPGQSTLGPIQIDAATLVTDSRFRNGAINNFVLQTGAFPLITFTPTSFDGLPQAVAAGDSLSFTVSGDLTIRDVTLPVTFDVTVSVESPTRLTGLARATILRSDFGLTIPSVPQVAEVSDDITLEFQFAAAAP